MLTTAENNILPSTSSLNWKEIRGPYSDILLFTYRSSNVLMRQSAFFCFQPFIATEKKTHSLWYRREIRVPLSYDQFPSTQTQGTLRQTEQEYCVALLPSLRELAAFASKYSVT